MLPTPCYYSIVDADKKSKVTANKHAKAFSPAKEIPGFKIQELFYTEDSPQTEKTRHQEKPYDINLPTGAMRAFKIKMPPFSEIKNDMANAGIEIPENPHEWGMHKTNTADYWYILSGEVTYIAENKEPIILKKDGFISIVASTHTWINHTDEPCLMFGMMLGLANCKP